MQLIVDIQNDSIANKIIDILNVFKSDGVKITLLENKEKLDYENIKKLVTTKKDFGDDFEVMEEAISNWQKEIMTNEDPNIDDDEVLPQAYWEFNNEKYTDR